MNEAVSWSEIARYLPDFRSIAFKSCVVLHPHHIWMCVQLVKSLYMYRRRYEFFNNLRLNAYVQHVGSSRITCRKWKCYNVHKKNSFYISVLVLYIISCFFVSQRVCGSFHHSIYALQMYAMILEAFVIFKGHQSTNSLRSVEGFLSILICWDSFKLMTNIWTWIINPYKMRSTSTYECLCYRSIRLKYLKILIDVGRKFD